MKKRLVALILVVFLLTGVAVSSFSFFDQRLPAAAVAAEESFIPAIQGEAVRSTRSDRSLSSDPLIAPNGQTQIIRRIPDTLLSKSCIVLSLAWNVDQSAPGQEVFLTATGTDDCDKKILYLSLYQGSQFLEELPVQFDETTAQLAWTVPASSSRTNRIASFFRTLFRRDVSSVEPITYTATTPALVASPTVALSDAAALITSDPLIIQPLIIREPGIEPSGGTDLTCPSITQYGITWTFASPYPECGQFVNGDWYVIEPVTITSKTPAQTSNPWRHGDWINGAFNLNGIHGVRQPYDDRLNGNEPGSIYTFGTFDASLRPTYPLTFTSSTYPTGISLISTISQPEGPRPVGDCWPTFSDTGTSFHQQCNRGPVMSAAVLTILPTIPPADSFRPPYMGTDKTVRFTRNDLDYSQLGNIAPVGSISTYSLQDINRHIERVNLQTAFWTSEQVQPANNANGYGQFMAADLGLAALVVNLNYPLAQKEPLVISLVQRGIDFYGVLMNSGIWPDTFLNVNWNQAKWFGNGGHGSGRMFPILFAGTLLHDTAMQDIGFTIAHDYSFGELAQTFTVKDYTGYTSTNFPTKDLWNCVGGGINCNRGGYTVANLGLPEYGFTHFHAPNNDDSTWFGDSYRLCCTANAWNSYILASYIMGIEDKWNSPVLLTYMDRYMEITGSGGQYPAPAWQRGWLPPFHEMWDTYRQNYRERWTVANLCTEGATRLCALQQGVCAGLRETCEMKNWWGCAAPTYSPTNYANNLNYQVIETRCDGLDNDCDGQIDEGCGTPTTPTPPSGLTVTTPAAPAGQTQLQLDWQDNSNNENTFEIQRRQQSTNPPWTWATIANVPGSSGVTGTFTDTLLSSGTYYEYHIRAVNAAGTSAWHPAPPINFISGTTLPTAPSTLQATVVSSTSIRLTWQDTSTGEQGFRLERRTLPSGTFAGVSGATALAPNTQQFPDTGLTANTAYEYQVRSYNAGGPSGWSNLVQGTTFICTSGQPRLCAEQRGVCQGSTETCTTSNTWPIGGCTTAIYQNNAQATYGVNYEAGSETLCDGQDNNCNGQTDDIQAQYAPLCANQVGVCSGARQSCGGSLGWQACTPPYQTETNRCTNTWDDDCDGRADYAGPRTTAPPPDGDNDCPVSITDMTTSATICPSTLFTVQCTTSASNVLSAQAFLGTTPCTPAGLVNNVASFTCQSQATAGSQTARCTINPAISYQSGPDQTRPVTVGITTGCTCGTYTTQGQGICEGDTSCDWCLGCSSSGSQYSGGGNRCVQAGSCTYSCIAGQCNAPSSCTATSGCTQTQTCTINTCGCIEENPRLFGISLPSIAWSSSTSLTLRGQYFATNAEVRIDGIAINPTRITSRSATQIVFDYQPRDYRTGLHDITIYNPPPLDRSSTARQLRITAVPTISIRQSFITNNIVNSIDLDGNDLDPIAVLVGGQFWSLTSWTAVTHQHIQVTAIPVGATPGTYEIIVVNNDLTPSNNPLLRVNQPFTYTLDRTPATAIVIPNSQLQGIATITAVPFSVLEPITLTITPPNGITVSYSPSGNTCTPSTSTLTCQIPFILDIGSVALQLHTVSLSTVSAPSSLSRSTSIILTAILGTVADCRNGVQNIHETCNNPDGGGPICSPVGYVCDYEQSCLLDRDCVMNERCGTGLCWQRDQTCRPDADCDTVPDHIDRCSNTTAGVPQLSLVNGCPLPRAERFAEGIAQGITTDLSQVEDLEAVQDLSLGIIGVGRLFYEGETVSLLRTVNTIHEALDLDTAITMEPNLIGLSSADTPELDHPAELTFYGLTSTTAPTPLEDGEVCTDCVSRDYSNGIYRVAVTNFSDYSTQAGTCEDGYCNLDETCSSCSQDCGTCSSPGPTSGGGPSGGGGGRGTDRAVVDLDTNVQQTIAALKNSRISLIYQSKEYGLRIPRATQEEIILTLLGTSFSIPLNQQLGIDITDDGRSDISVQYDSLRGNLVTLTFGRIVRNISPVRASTADKQQTQQEQETQEPEDETTSSNRSIFSSFWVRIPLVVFVLVLAFYFRYVRFRIRSP